MNHGPHPYNDRFIPGSYWGTSTNCLRIHLGESTNKYTERIGHQYSSVARVYCWPRTLLSLSSGGSQSGLAKFSQAQFHPCHCTLSVTLTQGEEEDKGGVVRDLTQDEDQGDPHNASSASRSAPCRLPGCCLPPQCRPSLPQCGSHQN